MHTHTSSYIHATLEMSSRGEELQPVMPPICERWPIKSKCSPAFPCCSEAHCTPSSTDQSDLSCLQSPIKFEDRWNISPDLVHSPIRLLEYLSQGAGTWWEGMSSCPPFPDTEWPRPLPHPFHPGMWGRKAFPIHSWRKWRCDMSLIGLLEGHINW